MTSQRTLPVPDPSLVDGELSLRPWEVGDAPALATAWSDPVVALWTGVPPTRDEASARRWIEGTPGLRSAGRALDLAVVEAGTVVGEVGVAVGDAGSLEIGWWIGPASRGQGRAARAVGLFARWVTVALDAPVVARCHPENPASSAVARRAGFVEQPPDADGTRIWVFSRPP